DLVVHLQIGQEFLHLPPPETWLDARALARFGESLVQQRPRRLALGRIRVLALLFAVQAVRDDVVPILLTGAGMPRRVAAAEHPPRALFALLCHVRRPFLVVAR